jgi:hypothetical protein
MYGGAAAGAAAGMNAVKASGAIVQVEPEVFQQLANNEKSPLIVIAQGGFLNKGFRYLMGHRGLVFFTKSSEELMLPGGTQLISAAKIWIPSS